MSKEKDKTQSRWDWRFGFGEDSILKNKEYLKRSYIAYMMNRTQEMFKWNGLPETIPYRELERILQTYGKAFIVKKNGDLYAVWGEFGGELNPYYFPVNAIISNPWLDYVQTDVIGKDCELIRNDFLMLGLIPLSDKYASLLAEADISIRYGEINSRFRKIIIADNDKAKADADQYLKDVEEGQKLSSIGAKAFFDGIKIEEGTSGANNQIKELIELKQYLISQWFIELGLNSNFNMKREAINSAESGMNADILLPLVDQMWRERKEACERINKLYGTNISVELDSSWKDVHETYHAKTDGMKEPEENGKEEDGNDGNQNETGADE